MKKLKFMIITLFVILLSVIAFFGVFQKENGVWKKVIPDYQYGMDTKGVRELRYAVDNSEEEKYVYVDEAGNIKGEVWKEGNSITQENENEEAQSETEENTQNEAPYAKETRTIKVNPDEKLTKENFEQAKKIIQNRLNRQEIGEYHIRIDDVTGKLVIENADNEEEIQLVQQLVSKPGKFKVVDYQNGVVLMDNADIKKASVVYSNQEAYNTYLQIEFNKEGAEKLRKISTQYVETEKEQTEENQTETEEGKTENEQTEEEHNYSYISIVLDDTNMMTTYFGEEMTTGMLQIAVGQARKSYEEFRKDYNSAKTIADMLNTGILPITYELETDNFVKSEMIRNWQKPIKIFLVLMVVGVSLVYIIKFKKMGALGAVLNIGYIAIFSLLLRFTNVEITMNAIIAGVIMVVLNMLYTILILKQLITQNIEQAYSIVSKRFYLVLIPIMIVAIVFTLTKYYAISSVGMVVFWGILLNALYNFIVIKTVLRSGKD